MERESQEQTVNMSRREFRGYVSLATGALLGANGYSIYKDIAKRWQQCERAAKDVTARGTTPQDQERLDCQTKNSSGASGTPHGEGKTKGKMTTDSR